MTYRAVKSLFPSMEFWLFHLQPKFTWITLNASFIHPKKQFISPVHYCATKYIRISERVENYCFYYGWINLRTSLPASHSSTVPCRWFSDSLPLHISTSCFFFSPRPHTRPYCIKSNAKIHKKRVRYVATLVTRYDECMQKRWKAFERKWK